MKKYTKAALYFLILILAGVLTGCSSGEKKEELCLMDYIEAEYIGTREQVQVTLKPDIDKIQEKYKEIKEEKSVIDAVIFSKFMNELEMEYDKNDTLYKDGDIIHVKFQWNEQAAEECIYKMEDEADFEVNISEKTQELDPFENLQLDFSGMNGEGWVDFNEENCPDIVRERGIFEAIMRDEEGDEGVIDIPSLKNGDKVIVEFTWRDGGSAYRKENMLMSESRKEYVVKGLGDYAEMIQAEEMEDYNQAMLEEVKEEIRSWKHSGQYSVTPYQYQYYYNADYMGENAYVGIYKVENTTIKEDTFYFVALTFPVHRDFEGDLIIDSHMEESGTESYIISTDMQERCVMQTEEVENLPAFLHKNEWLDLETGDFQFLDVE